MEGLAAQAAIAMDNARLYSNAQVLLAREQDARKEVELASRAKDEFLGMLSHELRTPLNAILGWTRMLATAQLDPETSRRAVETIERSAKAQARLIDDMLDVSRIISGKLRLDVQPVDLSSVVNAAVDTSRPAAEAKSIRIQMTLDFGAGQVLGDPVRLQQVAWNLLSNAIKFTPKNGSVQVQLARVNSHIDLTVSDTGPGIEEDFLPHMFERFRQADSSISRKYGGLGLGLAIVRHLVELHGGTVEARNREEGTGAIISVTLPLMAVRHAPPLFGPELAQTGLGAFQSPASLRGVRVLAVDDEPDARSLLKTVLEQCGVEVRTCGSATDALAELEKWRPDVLVSDIGMPEEDGYFLIRGVRRLSPESGGRTPAVALTAYARVEDRLHALSAGYNMHVPKPVEPTELALVIASLLGRSSAG